MRAQFFYLIEGEEVAGPVIDPPRQITAEDARLYPLPDNATSGVLRVQGGEGEEWPCPEPEPPSILEIFAAAVEAAKAAILQLKAAAWTAQVAAGVSQADATANGVVFAAHHAAAIANYELAGGHPIAAAALLDAIQADTTHTWLQLPGVMQVFEAALAPPA